jgi:hypothetical protein
MAGAVWADEPKAKPAPITAEEAQQFVDAIDKAVRERDMKACKELIDWNAVVDAATAEPKSPKLREIRTGFKKGVVERLDATGGLLAETAKVVAEGASYKCIRIATGVPEPYVLYRLKFSPGGFNHHRYFLTRKEDGTVAASDIHILMSDERMSKTLERTWRMAADAFAKPKPGAKTDDLAKLAAAMTEFSGLVSRGKNREALQKYQKLPEALQRDKNMLLLRFKAAQDLDETGEYEAAIDDYRKYHPKDSALDLLLIDSHVVHERYADALKSVELVNRNTGGDPYLDVLRATMLIKLQRFPEAREAIAKAVKAEPDLIDASFTSLDLALAEKKFDEVVGLLKKLEAEGYRFENLPEAAGFEEFVASPQYAEWKKSHAGTPEPKK